MFPKSTQIKSSISRHNRGYWRLKTNQRLFLQNLQSILNIKNLEDWGRVTNNDLTKYGGITLFNFYGNSLYEMMKSVFSEIEWKKEWFPKENDRIHPYNFWKDKNNQRQFLEQIATKYAIKKPEDWRYVSSSQIRESGGGYLLRCYGNSLRKLVISNFPEVKWRSIIWKERMSKHFWISEVNQRNFIHEISNKYYLKHATDWKRVSLKLIKANGGKGLLEKYNYSLISILQKVFPENDWKSLLTLNKSSSLQENSLKFVSLNWFL